MPTTPPLSNVVKNKKKKYLVWSAFNEGPAFSVVEAGSPEEAFETILTRRNPGFKDREPERFAQSVGKVTEKHPGIYDVSGMDDSICEVPRGMVKFGEDLANTVLEYAEDMPDGEYVYIK